MEATGSDERGVGSCKRSSRSFSALGRLVSTLYSQTSPIPSWYEYMGLPSIVAYTVLGLQTTAEKLVHMAGRHGPCAVVGNKGAPFVSADTPHLHQHRHGKDRAAIPHVRALVDVVRVEQDDETIKVACETGSSLMK